MPPLVHIVTLNWQNWRETFEVLYALRELKYSPFKTVVVDNGSKDDSVRRLRETFPEVEILENGANLGFAGGNNVAIRRALDAGADYVWLINNDAKPAPDALAALVALAERDPRAGAVGSVIYNTAHPEQVDAWGGGSLVLWMGWSRFSRGPDDPLQYITGTSMLLKAAALRDVGLLDERFFIYWEDTDLSFRLRAKGWNLAAAESSRVWHTMSTTMSRHPYQRAYHIMRSFVLFLRKHSRAPLPNALSALAFQSLGKLRRGDLESVRGMWRGWAAGWKTTL
jgi:GT2 family glycosyltransferase